MQNENTSAPTLRTIQRTECAKMIRARLKAKFPGVKFSVTSQSYSGGGSINIKWTDGPAYAAVEEIADSYQSSRFDSMIDYGYSVRAFWLAPDGAVTVAHCEGSTITGGQSESEIGLPPAGAELVEIYSGYVFCSREYSAPLLERIANIAARKWGFDVPPLVYNDYGGVYLDTSKLDHWGEKEINDLKRATDAREKPVYRYNHAAGKLEPVAAN